MAGGRWGVLSSVVEQVVGAAVTAVLARLLVPRELGLVAGATVVIGLFALLTRVGVLPGIVRRRTFDHRAASTAFWGAALLGGAGTLLAAVTAPWTAAAMGMPRAAGLVAGLSLMIVLGLLANVVQGVALRSLQYRVVYGSDVLAALGYAGAAVVAAGPLELGAWSIVVGRLVGAGVRLAALLAGARWRPVAAFDLSTLREDAGFNAIVLGSQVTGFASKNADYWVVGRAFSPAALGVYYVAYVVPTILRQRLTWLANELLFPALVRVRDRGGDVLGAHAEAVRLLTFVSMPALFGMALVAGDVAKVAFGERWAGAGPPMAALAVAAAVEVVTQVDTTLFLSVGRPRRTLVVNLVRLVVLAVLLPVAVWRGGLVDIALAVLASGVAAQAVAQHAMADDFGVRTAGLARVLAPSVVPTAVMAAAVGAVLVAMDGLPSWVRLAVAVVVGVAVFGGAALALFRTETLTSLRQVRALALGRRGAGAQ